MRRAKRLCALVLIAAALMINTLAIGAELRQMSITSDTTPSELLDSLDWLDTSKNGFQSKKFTTITNVIEDTYYFGITSEELFESIVNGTLISLPQNNIDYIYSLMFQKLDTFSYYLPPIYNSIFDEPHYTGFGVVIYDTKRNKYTSMGEGLYIEEVYAGSPAAEAGIQPYDKIVAIDGIKVENLTLNALTTLMSTYGNTDKCTLTLSRNGVLMNFTIVKKNIPAKELMTSFYPEYSTAKFDITAFNSSTLKTVFEEAVKETHELGYKNLIIDLRDNPGGVVDYAMKTTDTLITQEHLLFTFLSKGEVPFMEYTSDAEGYDFENIYIMVNSNTASAAEAMTISLKALANAVIVGTTTYGKEVGQVIYPLDDNSSFALTTIKGYGPNGEDYNTVGIVPDHIVENENVEFSLPENYLPLTVEQLGDIRSDGDANAIMAMEQRLCAIKHLPDEYVDGIYDENTDANIKILQTMRGEELGVVTPELLTYLDKTIESYHGLTSQPVDNQLDYVMELIMANKN